MEQDFPKEISIYFMTSEIIPLGVDCSVSHYLRNAGKRTHAFPFDWTVTPICSAIRLIENGFENFMEEDNLVFLPPEKRKLYNENGIDLKVTDEIITPVVCKKYRILFPHDFSEKGKEDLPLVKEKYNRRIRWVLKSLTEMSKVVFVFNLREINQWQISQYGASGVNFPLESEPEVYREFKCLRRICDINIQLVALKTLQKHGTSLLEPH